MTTVVIVSETHYESFFFFKQICSDLFNLNFDFKTYSDYLITLQDIKIMFVFNSNLDHLRGLQIDTLLIRDSRTSYETNAYLINFIIPRVKEVIYI